MIKSELAQALSAYMDEGGVSLTNSEATKAIDGIIEIIGSELKHGRPVFLRGFGTFQIVKRKAKAARNIKLNQTILIPERKVIKFKPSQYLTVDQD